MEIFDLYQESNSLLSTEENVLKYRTGGYHPVSLGDTLKDGRYKICHKLGYGSFSTVWVARDSKLQQWVSVKIMKADRTNPSRELVTLQALADCSKNNPGSKHIVRMLDSFLHVGPNGRHQCLVLELLGPTVNTWMDEYHYAADSLDEDDILMISTRMLQAVTFMHEAGYAHGDLSVGNLAFPCDHLSRASEDELFQVLGSPESQALIRSDGKSLEEGVPKYLIKSATWEHWLEECDFPVDIRLIDLGETFHQNAVPERIAQPFGLQAPETFSINGFDYRLDLWRAGLLIYFLMFREIPFQCHTTENLIARFDKFESFLEWRFRKTVHKPQLQVFLPVMKGLTRLLPSERITASQALEMIKADVLVGSSPWNSNQKTAALDGEERRISYDLTTGSELNLGYLRATPPDIQV